MFKYDGKFIVLSGDLRKIVSDLLNEENYSGEEIEVEPPTRRYNTHKKRNLKKEP